MDTEGRFAEKTTLHIRSLSATSPAMRAMYDYDPEHENIPADTERDLLLEKVAPPVFGVVRKFDGRLLVLLSYTCAAHCRYCERQDRVGVGLDRRGRLTTGQLDDVIDYIRSDESITEVIASGGDPLTHPRGLEYLFGALREVEHVKVLRIHTRFPLQTPRQVDVDLMGRLATCKTTVFLSLHVDQPDELTPEVVDLIGRFRGQGYILISQSVFLKGVNDDVETLATLFGELFFLGVRPYYIYHCQRIETTARFEMEFDDEIKIMSTLRERLSGLAYPQHVLDLPGARGKVVVPSEHWDFDHSRTRDFDGRELSTDTWQVTTAGEQQP